MLLLLLYWKLQQRQLIKCVSMTLVSNTMGRDFTDKALLHFINTLLLPLNASYICYRRQSPNVHSFIKDLHLFENCGHSCNGKGVSLLVVLRDTGSDC